MANQTLRMGVGANQDMTGRNYSYDYQTPSYAASIALPSPIKTETLVKPATLTGALALSVDVTDAYIGDKIIVMLTADGSNRTTTFGSGFSPSATLVTTASKSATASFIFNGVAFVEMGRAIGT